MAELPTPRNCAALAPVHFLHIRKTGGTSIKDALARIPDAHRIELHDHSFYLSDVPDGHGVFFFIRDPVSRFVSGFNCRLRKGQPRFNVAWNRGETKAFKLFKSANQLAESLSAHNATLRESAQSAMGRILHVREPLTDWFARDLIEARLKTIVWIGAQGTLKEDFEAIKSRLELPAGLALPEDERDAHVTPAGFSAELSEAGRRNIEDWYADDMRLYAYLRDLKERFVSLNPTYVRPVLSEADVARHASWSASKDTKVFGIGFHKTGTKSLSLALRKLGYAVRSATGVKDKEIAANAWDRAKALIDHYDAFEDNPWPILFKELYAYRPGSKFILTVRPADKWIRSAVDHFGPDSTPMREWIYGVGTPVGNEDRYIERYERHNREVMEFFADKPGSLLVMDFGDGDGWEKLCGFLGESIPPGPFPHKHSKEDRQRRQPQLAPHEASAESLQMG